MDNSYPIKPFLLDLAFPKFCLGCNKEGAYLCQDCWHLLEIMENSYCLCQKPQLLLNPKIGKCRHCQEKRLLGLFFAVSYKNKIAQKIVRSFKYAPFIKDLAETMALVLAEHFVKSSKNNEDFWANSVLIPIPLDEKKLRERGYNQSEELARELSKITKARTFTNVLKKTKNTKPQMTSSKQEREKNLSGAFLVKNFAGLADKKIFLVDDVYTTGATMEECAKTLRKVGLKNVWGICFAREEYT